MTDRITGIILAGGESRRMGRDKAHLPWGRTTLLEHVIARVRPAVDELLVVVRDARTFRRLDATVVEDLIPNAHALGGLYTGLRLARYTRCFVCACDMPFISPRLIRALAAQADDCDAVIPRTAHGLQMLHAVYAASALPAVARQLGSRRHRLHQLASTLRITVVGPQVLAAHDPAGVSCVNVNTPQEYAQACASSDLTRVIDGGPEHR